MEVKPGYKQTEVGVIPEEWEVKRLGELATLKNGYAFKSDTYTTLGNFKVITIANVQDGYMTARECNSIACEPKDLQSHQRLQIGDILISMTGNVGRVCRVTEKNCLLNQRVGKLIPTAVDDATLFILLGQPSFIKAMTGVAKGGAQPNLSVSEISDHRFCVPASLPEQRAIATALSDVDGLLGGLDRLIAKKRDLKQAAMQQLLTGQIRLPGFHGEWEVKRLGDCLLSRPDYGINAAAVPFSDKLPSYIRITDISEHGRFCPDPRVSVNAASSDQYYLHEGDVVFARTGASVGKSYLYEARDGELVFAGFLIRVRPNPGLLLPAFLTAYATTKPYWNWVRLMSMRSGQPGINGNEYAQLPLSLPFLPEQIAIAEVLTDMDAELAALEQRREKTRALKQAMMQELLTGRTRLV